MVLQELWENEIPFVFVTNGTYSSANLVSNLTNILGLPFTNDHVVVAPSPCKELTEYHNKRVLVCGQDDSVDLVKEFVERLFSLFNKIFIIFFLTYKTWFY